MYKIFLRLLFLVPLFLSNFWGNAQDSLKNEKPQMADLMRSDGKIYVVVTVLLIILAGLFVYLLKVDRKVTRLEKNIK